MRSVRITKLFLLIFIIAFMGIALWVNTSPAESLDLSGSIDAETIIFTNDPLYEDQTNHIQSSLILKPEFRYRSNDRYHQFVFSPFLRLDGKDSERTHFDVREGYWLYIGDDWEILAGINKVFWGVSESRHLVDVINQTDLVESLDGEDKLGQQMISISAQRDWGRVETFVMPGFRERTYPGENGRLRSPLVVDTDNAVYESGAEENHVDLALRYSHTLGDWDMGVHYFRGTGRDPRLLVNDSHTKIVPYYDQINQFGIDIQYTLNAWLWKFEGLVREGQGDTFGAYVGGFEYTLYQIFDSAADLGFLLEYSYDGRDEDPSEAPVTIYDDLFFYGARLALNDIQDTEFLAGVLVDNEDHTTSFSIEAERRFKDRISIELEGRFFQNVDQENPLYATREDSYISMTISYGI